MRSQEAIHVRVPVIVPRTRIAVVWLAQRCQVWLFYVVRVDSTCTKLPAPRTDSLHTCMQMAVAGAGEELPKRKVTSFRAK